MWQQLCCNFIQHRAQAYEHKLCVSFNGQSNVIYIYATQYFLLHPACTYATFAVSVRCHVCLFLCTLAVWTLPVLFSPLSLLELKSKKVLRIIPQLQLPNNETITSVFFSDYRVQRGKKLLINQKQTTLPISHVCASNNQSSCSLHACLSKLIF